MEMVSCEYFSIIKLSCVQRSKRMMPCLRIHFSPEGHLTWHSLCSPEESLPANGSVQCIASGATNWQRTQVQNWNDSGMNALAIAITMDLWSSECISFLIQCIEMNTNSSDWNGVCSFVSWCNLTISFCKLPALPIVEWTWNASHAWSYLHHFLLLFCRLQCVWNECGCDRQQNRTSYGKWTGNRRPLFILPFRFYFSSSHISRW